MPFTRQTSKIAIIGAGDVSAAIAFSLILNPIAGEALMVDVDPVKLDGQVQDLSDATYQGNTSTRIRAATPQEADQADIVVITAGAKQRKGESRLALIDRTSSILHRVITALKPLKSSTVPLLVASPVDVLVYDAQRISGPPHNQVLGSRTFLDSLRPRRLLAEHAGVAPSSIDAYVLGEHGDGQFVSWSAVTLGGVPIAKALPHEKVDRHALAGAVKRKAQRVIEAKGATAYGVGSAVSSICGSVLFDERNVRPVSHFVERLGCCLSLPVILGRRGVVGAIEMELSLEEEERLRESAEELRGIIRDCEEKQGGRQKRVNGAM